MSQQNKMSLNTQQPDDKGYFGEYGGAVLPPDLAKIMNEITDSYNEIKKDDAFIKELTMLQQTYTGRPSPVYHAKRLSSALGGAQIYLKREDLNHTGAHKINHCLGEVLLAKKMGKKKVIAETGAGQHGVALATAAALVGLECDIYMGEVDVAKQAPNVRRMQVLGAKVVSVTRGTKTLKDAVDAAFEAYLEDPVTTLYAIGSVVGPHPFPMMVRDFQSVVGREAREQFLAANGTLPDKVIACVGGGSNAIGIFSGFLDDEDVQIIGVEPGGRSSAPGDHAATMTYGKKGTIHGFECYLLQDEKGDPLPVYSIASGLDYPGVGPQHCYLHDIKRVEYVKATDREALVAFYDLSRLEGIIPALESSHALAHAIRIAPALNPEQKLLINLSGRGDKDMDYVLEHYPLEEYEQQRLLFQ
ncbi:MAG: tryptophan synthase subunit beta [Sphaerochaetaceae bacterium]|nr:tryptophan synthase subunit beta [Sphaerochaetaceae bacterium]